MFEWIITTEYNVIKVYEEDYTREELFEILMQPYVINAERIWVEQKTKKKVKSIDSKEKKR